MLLQRQKIYRRSARVTAPLIELTVEQEHTKTTTYIEGTNLSNRTWLGITRVAYENPISSLNHRRGSPFQDTRKGSGTASRQPRQK